MNNSQEYLGKRYGRLKIIGFEHAPRPNRKWMWVCECDCGTRKVLSPGDVKNGKVRSCGCLHNECAKERATKFKHSVYEYKRLYSIYNGIKKRCYNRNELRYKDYGARGIVMCDEWLNPRDGFDRFAEWALSNGYDDTLTIERIDVNGDYAPYNCKWITLVEQSRNKRCTKWVEYKGERIQLIVLCQRENVCYDTVHDRIYHRGWELERAIKTPSQRAN